MSNEVIETEAIVEEVTRRVLQQSAPGKDLLSWWENSLLTLRSSKDLRQEAQVVT